jgi:pyridoxine kinase
MRILSISSQVAFGPVGNSAVVPALQAKGHEVVAIPTIMLSNHPGHGKPAGFRTTPEDMRAIFDTLHGLGVFAQCGAVLTGYFASVDQVHETARLILTELSQASPSPFILVDPVIGDDTALYVPQDVAVAIRDYLLPLASCLTPNRFELEWLSGGSAADEQLAIEAARKLPALEVLATSIPRGDTELATLLVTADAVHRHVSRKLDHVPQGTGDFLSGLYLAARVSKGAEDAFIEAMETLERAIAMSAGTSVLNIAGALHGA